MIVSSGVFFAKPVFAAKAGVMFEKCVVPQTNDFDELRHHTWGEPCAPPGIYMLVVGQALLVAY